MEAQTLNCPNCGAAISSDSPQCQYCESKLATVACPSCFGMMFLGSKHCPHCGAAAVDAASAELSVLNVRAARQTYCQSKSATRRCASVNTAADFGSMRRH